MLFQGFSSQRKAIGGGNPWTGHPFNLGNNINGINGDPSGNDNGEEVHSLIVPAITSLQEAYVRKVVDTLNDLDNVLYEISGDAPAASREWQYHMINYLKSYEATKPKQHAVGMSYMYLGSTNDLLASPADWIVLPGTDTNPPPAAGGKVILSDMDPKLLGGTTSYLAVWKSFMRGLNPIYLESDLQNPSADENVRDSMGYTLKYSQLVDLSSISSRGELCSSGYCLINPGFEYLVYLPGGGTVRVDLSAASGSFVASWFSPVTGRTTSGGTVSAGIPILFTSPIDGDAVLYLQAMPALSSQNSASSVGLSSSDTVLTAAATSTQTSSLSLSNTGPVTVTQGSSATTAINAALAAGSRRRSISFSVSGLPQGVSAAFSPNSCTPNCSTQLTLGASSSAVVGNYTITVSGKNKQYQASTSFALSVTQPATIAVNAPTITPNGGTFTNAVTVTLQTSTVGASIHYTADGTNPTQSSQQYTAPFALTTTSLVKAQAFKNGMTPSSQASAWFTKEVSGTITLAWADNSNNENGFGIERKAGTNGTFAQIATVAANVNSYTDSGLIAGNTYCYRVNAFNTAGVSTYTNEVCKNITGSAPTFNFSLGNDGNKSVTQGQSITSTVTATLSTGSSQAVSFSTAGLPTRATASYTTSTSCNPTCSRSLNIATAASTPTGTYTITVSGIGGGVTKSTNFSLAVTSPTATVATPTISPNGGSFTGSVSVTLQTATSGASIHYTTDGSPPTQSSSLYAGAFTLTSNATVKAMAFKIGSNTSAQASASFTVVPLPAQLTLSWSDNSNNENNFAIERKTGTSGTYSQIALTTTNITSYVDTSVTRGGSYCYRVRAVNSVGASAYTNEACGTVANFN